MSYFKIQAGVINKVVGDMASHKMTSYYRYDRPNSVYKLKIRGKLDFAPDIDAIQILKRAKLMDVIVSVPLAGNGLVISDRLRKIIANSVMPIETQIFDAYVLFKEEKKHFNFLYIYDAQENEIVDWSKSLFMETSVGGFEQGNPKKYSFEAFKIEKIENYKYFKPSKLVLKKDKLNSDIIRLDYTHDGYYVSEKLKQEIENSDCQGVDLIPIDQLGFEVEFV